MVPVQCRRPSLVGWSRGGVQFDVSDLYAIFAVVAEDAGQLYLDIINGD